MTDHHSLFHLKRVAEPKGRLARWILELAEHQFSIVHRSGILHGDADALSRCPLACTEADSLEEQLFVTIDQPPLDLEEVNRKRFATEQSRSKYHQNPRRSTNTTGLSVAQKLLL